ncbi:macoilin-1-like [Antedon mediterranea]|uniref:macoilin-1-like n=1 Tax=Antedon mediterranea TaxID=105859 RepID=UPI003AF40D6C
MKRRNADCGRLKRPIKRNKITENIYGSTFMYLKFLMLWGLVLFLDFILEFRVEYIWPLWLLFRSLYDSYRYQGLAFSVFFVFIAITSDMICLLFIPVHWLFFAASTYVWVQFVWHTDRGICLPTVSLWLLFVYVEAVVRLREVRTTIPFHLDLCRPFAAHCIGYPVVTLGFGFKSYVGYKMRLRKQKEVEKENEFYMQLLHQALPQEQQQQQQQATTEKPKAILSTTKSDEKDSSQASSNVKPKGSPSQKTVDGENVKDKEQAKKLASTNNLNLKTGEPDERKLTQRIVNSYEGTSENIMNEHTLAKNNKHVVTNGVSGKHRSSAAAAASRESMRETQGSTKKGKQYSSKVENKEKEVNVSADMQISNGAATSVSKDEKTARYEVDIKRLKADLQGSRQNEIEMKAIVKSLRAQEEVIMAEIDQIKKDNEQLQTKLHNLVTQKQQDKLTLSKIEQKWKSEIASRNVVENQLKEERKSKRADEAAASRAIAMAAANAARMNECNGSCKMRQSELEKELKMFKEELKDKRDSMRALEKEAENLRHKPEQQQQTKALMAALAVIKDQNTELENSLSAETRVKLDLFSALGEARRHLEIAQAQLLKKDQDIHELKTKIAEVMAVMPQSTYPCTTTPITPTKPHYSVAFRQQLDDTSNSQRSSLDPNAAVYRPKSN